MTVIKIADIPIGLECRFAYTENYVKDYITDDKPVFTVSASDAEIEREFEISGIRIQPEYVENVVMYRKIAERLADFDAIVFHGAVLEYDGAAYAVTAHSGVGKTTHTRIWIAEFGDAVKILNGDKPILRLISGKPYACSTPWMGKEGYGYNAMRPLSGIAFLARGLENKSKKINPSDAVMRFMNQVYLSKANILTLTKSMRVVDSILSLTPLYELECNMQAGAAHVARDAFVNGNTTE